MLLRGIESGPIAGQSRDVTNRPRMISYIWIQSLNILYQIWIIPDSFPFPIPYCAWREFHSNSLVPSTCAKEPAETEKSSIFNFGYVKQVWVRGLLGVNDNLWRPFNNAGLHFCKNKNSFWVFDELFQMMTSLNNSS